VLLLLYVCVIFVGVGVVCGVPFSSNMKTFGTAVSSASLPHGELTLYQYNVKGNAGAAITHWWFTGAPNVDNVIFRFYVDGESSASVAVSLDLAAGIGFDDEAAPWGTEMIGKGAATGGVYNNIKIPFAKSIKVTCEQPPSEPTGIFWFIVRGIEGVPITVGGIQLPPSARLHVLQFNQTFSPLALVNAVNVANTAGALVMWTLSVGSGNLNFLEGCVRCFIDGGPQMLLSSGTEDYFDSAFYFNAGTFRFPVSGLTHVDTTGKGGYPTTLSAYRFHEADPIVWNKSFKFVWRNGDTIDPANGQKCIDDGGNVVGNPTTSIVNSVAWVYLFPSSLV